MVPPTIVVGGGGTHGRFVDLMVSSPGRSSITLTGAASLKAIATAAVGGACTIALAGQVEGTDEDSGLPYWAWEEGPVEIRMVQRLPDQTRAFFIARGLSTAAADRLARSCVFQTIVRNRGGGGQTARVGVDLTAWRRDAGRGLEPIGDKDVWDREWAATGETRAARIAFHWAFFPTVQTFFSGDINWGMTSYGVPPGARFDLALAWTLDGAPRSAFLHGVTCAPEAVLERNPQ